MRTNIHLAGELFTRRARDVVVESERAVGSGDYAACYGCVIASGVDERGARWSFQKDLDSFGMDAVADGTPEKAAQSIKDEIAKWAPIVKATGIGAEEILR